MLFKQDLMHVFSESIESIRCFDLAAEHSIHSIEQILIIHTDLRLFLRDGFLDHGRYPLHVTV